jgi:hypothetical protein
LKISFLFSSLPNEVQVPESAFSAVRELGNIAARLQLDCLHAAVPSTHRKKMADIIKSFRAKQPSLVEDKIARDLVGRELRSAVDSTAFIIDRSDLETRVRDEGQRQPEGEITSRRYRSRWEFGINPQTPIVSNAKLQLVTIPGGRKARQCYLVATSMGKKAVNLDFTASLSPCLISNEPANRFLFTGYATITGWTLSCDNADGEKVSFKSSGGIGTDRLGIAAKATRGREWHCRVTFT